MPDYEIEQDAEGNLSYRGWPLEIVPCGSQFLRVPKGACACGRPMYLGYSPYEGRLEDWERLWPSDVPVAQIKPRYAEYITGRHVVSGSDRSVLFFPSVESVIDFLEELLDQARKKAWEEVANASQVP